MCQLHVFEMRREEEGGVVCNCGLLFANPLDDGTPISLTPILTLTLHPNPNPQARAMSEIADTLPTGHSDRRIMYHVTLVDTQLEGMFEGYLVGRQQLEASHTQLTPVRCCLPPLCLIGRNPCRQVSCAASFEVVDGARAIACNHSVDSRH
jgi:hypothetical protein